MNSDKKKKQWLKGIDLKKGIMILWQSLAFIFLAALLIAFPLYHKYKYVDMSYYKWIFYVAMMFLLLMVQFPVSVFGAFLHIRKEKFILQDYMVILYGLLSIITYANCSAPKAAFMGTDGWYMGLVAQVMFVLSYLVFCRKRVPANAVILLSCIGSFVCCIVAVCQRYGNDFLHLYWEMPAEIVRDYLSTIGNRTWFSAYVCSVFPIGVYLFWKENKVWKRSLCGIYTFSAFACLVTANSDSAYVGALAVFYLLFFMSAGNSRKIKKFCQIMLMWFGTCICMALLRIPYALKVRNLRGLSRVFLNIPIAVTGFLVTCLLLLLVKKYGEKIDNMNKKRWQKRILAAAFLVIVLVVTLIILNTSGMLQKLFGFTIQNSYLMFNDEWGDYRGSSWKLTVEMFTELPILQKIFGIGPDCFAYYAYGNSEYGQRLQNIWGEAILANAHNEWLNSILCMGIAGGTVYLSIFIGIMLRCLKMTEDSSENSIVPAIGLCVAGYVAHNFFCYQQVSATGVIFVLMGIASCQSKIDREYESGNEPSLMTRFVPYKIHQGERRI